MTSIRFGNQTYQFGQVTPRQVKPGSIIKVVQPEEPGGLGRPKTRYFIVDDVIEGKVFGRPTEDIEQMGGAYAPRPTFFEVLG